MTKVTPIFDPDSEYELSSYNGVKFVLEDDIKICFVYSDNYVYAQELASRMADMGKGKIRVVNMITLLSRTIGGLGIERLDNNDTRYDNMIFERVSKLLKEEWFMTPTERIIVYGPYVRYLVSSTLTSKQWQDDDSIHYIFQNYALVATKHKGWFNRLWHYMFKTDAYEERFLDVVELGHYHNMIMNETRGI